MHHTHTHVYYFCTNICVVIINKKFKLLVMYKTYMTKHKINIIINTMSIFVIKPEYNRIQSICFLKQFLCLKVYFVENIYKFFDFVRKYCLKNNK